MSQYRFFVPPQQISGRRVTLDGEQARQIYNVLRMRELDRVAVLDNSGWEYEVLLDKVTSDLVTGMIESRRRPAVEPRTALTLYQAMLKKDNFEWILQKGTELGVARFVPFISERSVVRQETLKPAKRKRWQRIISEAAEQSGRSHLPELAAPLSFDEALASAGAYDAALIPWVRESEQALAPALAAALAAVQGQAGGARVALFIGPEGGFADSEIVAAQAAGVRPVSLGMRILRAETAAIVAAALALSALGDL